MQNLDPEISFIPAVEEAFGADRVIVVKDAVGGRPIREWYKDWQAPDGSRPEGNGRLYDRLMAKVLPAIEGRTITTVTVAWMQGERDAREGYAEVYEASLNGLMDQFRRDLGRDDINLVIGRLSDYCMDNGVYPHWTRIRDIQVAMAEKLPRTEWIDCDDLNGTPEDLHYTEEGYRILGERFAEKAIALVRTDCHE